MLTLDRTQEPLALLERRSAQPTVLGGLLYAGLAIVPLTSEAPLSGLRLVGLLGLALVAGALVVSGLPKTRPRPLPTPSGTGSERYEALELGAEPLPLTYRASLVLADGSRQVVLERNEPAGVLADADSLARSLSVPLTPGWGLDDAELGEILHPPAHASPRWHGDTPLTFDTLPFAGQRKAALTTLWAAAFVLVATILMSASARTKVTPGLLSVALPVVSALLVLLVALWLLGVRGRLSLGPTGVTRRRFWFGLELGQPEAVKLAIRGAAVVSPAAPTLSHLLLATNEGLVAFAVRGGKPQAAALKNIPPTQAAHRAAE